MYACNFALPDTVPGSVCHLHVHSWREPMQQQVDLVNIGVSPMLSVSMLALMQVAGRHQLHTPLNINCKAESTWLGCQHNPLNADHHQSDAIPLLLPVNIGGCEGTFIYVHKQGKGGVAFDCKGTLAPVIKYDRQWTQGSQSNTHLALLPGGSSCSDCLSAARCRLYLPCLHNHRKRCVHTLTFS